MNKAVRIAQKKLNIVKSMVCILGLGLLTTSCIVEPAQSSRDSSTGAALANTKDTVNANYGRVLAANPTVLSGDVATESTDLSTLITRSPVYITGHEYLTKTCSLIGDCLEVTEDAGISPFHNPERQWAFPVTDTEFLQINAYYHVSKILDKYLDFMQNYADALHATNSTIGYTTSVPFTTNTYGSYWKQLSNSKLVVLADSSLKNNAMFDPTNFLISLGYLQGYKNIKMAQDPSVIYHEFGHTIVDRLINLRNRSYYASSCGASCIEESRLGYFGHDEAYSLNEGIADYFSYFVNGRTHMGEWALGKFAQASRPISEDDDSHISGISTDEDSRLSYPDYLGYNIWTGTSQAEDDIHLDGQIISHFLVALTRQLSTSCTGDLENAKKLVFYTLTETLSELGDLSAQGKDSYTNQINLDIDYATEWVKSVNPINFRRFSQALARNIFKITISTQNICSLNQFTQNDLEALLDSYGLLLFRSYNTDYNSLTSVVNQPVNQLNRKKSELINKNLLVKDTRSAYSAINVFDVRSSIYQTINNNMDLDEVVNVDAQYNNGNGKVSPGEIVGIFANIYNNSNSIMAGARVIASDWAHMEEGKPCSNLSDNFPSISQGGRVCDAVTASNYKDTGRIMPVCMLTYNDGTSSKLLNQHEFLKKMKTDIGLLEKDCLGHSETRTQEELNNCFVKAIPSANTQNVPFMLPKSNWQESLTDESGTPVFTDSNIMFFEINKNLPLGTEVTCRLRMTFSNCEDCYHDLNTPTTTSIFGNAQTYYDDYKDFEYAGERPFNILTINFTIEQ